MPPLIPSLTTSPKIGFIVPSSNTAVEPITTSLFHSHSPSHPTIIPLFTRIRVTTIGTDPTSTTQFATPHMIAAAQLLADAECAAILWNGTSGMWTGASLAEDRRLAETLTEATGVPCSTTTLATVAALEELGIQRFAVAVPYPPDLAEKVREFFSSTGHGWDVTKVTRLDPAPAGNLAIAKSDPAEIRKAIYDAAVSPDVRVVVVACTNWPAAPLVDELEQRVGGDCVVIDSILVTIWQGLKMIGCQRREGRDSKGWGRLLDGYL
ncbi:hypothetical protein BAUCODRAFT_231554 [Baudoinia panamericana UAMH 10762]|uniref:Asp/Glu racemase n=1 Tax=Baudoinia panamericana (strain UAMH 10762) TaxID=717646 RepID=M2M9V0_BAUPA|nr:uncharacterized protein BAUCODRAFT_231554 [Baudoinia panamericana UAMH 10762]EMC93226.1 hypothetical protein BAUCODRAFT_231554 [Baudoinia panamericana UAMH 10762]